MQRNLVTSLLLYERIRTTKKRAEVVRPIVEKLITTAKTKKPHIAVRSINAVVTHKNAARKTMEVLRDRFADRSSGFTRIVPLGSRHGDGAELVHLELVDAVVGFVSDDVSDAPNKKSQKKISSATSATSETSAPSKSK